MMMSPIVNGSVGYKPDTYLNSAERKTAKSTPVEQIKIQEKSKVESIKEQIANGTYKMQSSSVLAEKVYQGIF